MKSVTYAFLNMMGLFLIDMQRLIPYTLPLLKNGILINITKMPDY